LRIPGRLPEASKSKKEYGDKNERASKEIYVTQQHNLYRENRSKFRMYPSKPGFSECPRCFNSQVPVSQVYV
jgi:hypothetical protein